MRILRLILFFTSLFSVTFLLAAYLLATFSDTSASTGKIISPLLPGTKSAVPDVKSFSTDFATGLQEAVDEALSGSKATYSVIVKDLESSATFGYNPDRSYTTASLYKLWTMTVVYQQIEEGKLQKDEVLTSSAEDLNTAFDIASESAEITEGDITMTVEEALERMITVSENYPALLLTKKIGISKISTFLKEGKFENSSVGQPPRTTASDLAQFFTKLYQGELANTENTSEMITLLKRQRLNDRIPKYLPSSVEVAHKTGELEGVKHDAGIIYTETGTYILILLSDSNNPQVAAERMARISENIYTALTSPK